jgi:hypothetical protein
LLLTETLQNIDTKIEKIVETKFIEREVNGGMNSLQWM